MKKYSYTNKLKNVSSATEHPENEKLDLFQNAMIYLDVKTFSNVMRAIDYTLELRKKVSTSFFLDVTKKQFENKIMDHVNMHSYLPIDSRTHKKLNDLMKNEEFPKLTD